MDYKAASEKIRAYARTVVKESMAAAPTPLSPGQDTAERFLVVSLQLAWADSIRDQWEGFCAANPELKTQMAIAEELMKQEGYTADPICGPPGVEPMFAMVDGKKAVSFEHSMVSAMPLSAIFVNKVVEVLAAMAKVEAAAKQAEPKPDERSAEKTTAAVC